MTTDKAATPNGTEINVTRAPQDNDDIKYQPDRQSIVSDQKSFDSGDVLSRENVDPVLKAKLYLVNNVSDSPKPQRQYTKYPFR
jgi:hypothetical protein